MTATAVHAPYQCIDSRTREPFTHTKDTVVVQAYQIPDTLIHHSLQVNRFMLMARLAQYWLMDFYSRGNTILVKLELWELVMVFNNGLLHKVGPLVQVGDA